MSAPGICGIRHVTLSVADLDRTVEWYTSVLGFALVARATHGGLAKALLTRDGVDVSFVQHAEPQGGFDERRCGLDHLAFAVADAAEVETWAAHLDAHGVDRGEVTRATMGTMLAFRDPDGIALEVYSLA